MSGGMHDLVRYYLGTDVDDGTVNVATEKVIAKLASVTEVPQRDDNWGGRVLTKMIVAVPMIDTHISIKLANLVPNAMHPSGVRQFLAAKTSFAAANAGGPIAWLAFVLAMTALAARPVPFAEACVLHKAWRLAGFDRLVTVAELVQAGPSIVEEYGIVKVSADDMETYLNNLVRLGCVADHPNGYVLLERVVLAD